MQRYVRSRIGRSVPALVLFCFLLPSGSVSAQEDKAADACHYKQSTPEITDCLDKLTAAWDKRLNAAYQAAIKRADPAAVAPLRAAERAWLEYRKQRCLYRGTVEGTIGSVIASDCFMQMTKARTEELTADAKGLGE